MSKKHPDHDKAMALAQEPYKISPEQVAHAVGSILSGGINIWHVTDLRHRWRDNIRPQQPVIVAQAVEGNWGVRNGKPPGVDDFAKPLRVITKLAEVRVVAGRVVDTIREPKAGKTPSFMAKAEKAKAKAGPGCWTASSSSRDGTITEVLVPDIDETLDEYVRKRFM